MKENSIKLKKASYQYQLKTDGQLTENLLNYIQERIKANKKEIQELLKIKKETISYEDLERAIQTEIQQDIPYKEYQNLSINQDNFLSTSLLMPIGTIAVEVFETVEVVKYFIKAIKSRNAIAISDVEYDEQSVKFLILVIIKEALKKFNIDENLIMILPFEECFYQYFDKVIYTYDKQGKKLAVKQSEIKNKTDKKYIYVQNKKLEEIALRDNAPIETQRIEGTLEEVIQKINEEFSLACAIYTENQEIAYQFLKLVHSQNVLINTSLQNIKETKLLPDELYEYKNIILPIPIKEKSKEEVLKKEKLIQDKEQEMLLKIVNKGILDKIKEFLKRMWMK